jgi:hypothetical protein
MKQTAVEWLAEELEKRGSASLSAHYELFKQAKEMEKQQINNAYTSGLLDGMNHSPIDYFNKNYKK